MESEESEDKGKVIQESEDKGKVIQDVFNDFLDYFLGERNKLNFNLEKKEKEIIKKIKEDKAKKHTVNTFIKKLIQEEEKKKILDEMEKIFQNLIDKYKINKVENKKTFSGNIDENDKYFLNAIYISKNIEDDEISIHDYAIKLYDEKEVEEIEKGENENINEDFKKYFNDEIEPTDEEINEKYDKICKENDIKPEIEEPEQNPQTNDKSSNDINPSGGKNSTQTNENISDNNNSNNNIPQNSNNNQPDSLYKNEFNDSSVSDYYDIVFDIDSLENLKKNGWKFEATEKGYQKYLKKKDKKNTVVSVIGNKNKGKSFILSKISKVKIPDGHNITTRGLSVIYPDYDEKNVIFLDTAGFEIPLCEDDNIFKFETIDETYKKKIADGEKEIKIKDYINEDEYIDQIMKFTRDRQNTDYFLQKFIMNSADILLCITNKIDLSDQKFLNRIQEENKDKKIFIIHNLKTFKEINEVENYIENTLLKLLSFRLVQSKYTSTGEENNNDKDKKKENKIYYKQKFEESENNENKHREVIHLFMANDGSNAGNFYNDSTIDFIKNQIISFTDNDNFPIVEKVKDFLFDNSEIFFNEELEKRDELVISEDPKELKYTGKDFELKECYVDESGNTNFIQSNYKPYYRVYKAEYTEDEKQSIKLIIDIEISGKVEEIKIDKVSKNKQNIITIKGKRSLGKKKTQEDDNDDNKKKKNIFQNTNLVISLRIQRFLI